MQQRAIKLTIWAALLTATSSSTLDLPPFVPFIDLGASAVTLPHTNDGASGPIALPSGFPFGESGQSVSTVYVTTDGYFSVDNLTISSLPEIFSNDSSYDNIIAPFWADADPSQGGDVSYQIFTPENGSEWLDMIGKLVDYREGFTDYAVGEWMLVAEWHQVPPFNSTTTATNTFQGILFKLRDTSDAFVVFTYHCYFASGMQWSGNATIGWKSGYLWRNHPWSGRRHANYIVCHNYPSTGEWSNMVYALSRVEPCPGQFGCALGSCVDTLDECSGYPQCPGGSDESACETPPAPEPFCHGTTCEVVQCMTGYMEMRFDLSCISYKPCTDFFCLISGGMLNLTLAVLECHQPGAVRLAVTSLDDFVETTFTQSEIVEVAFIGNNATWYVMIEHLEGGTKLGFQVSVRVPYQGTRIFIPYSEIPLNTSGCQPVLPTPTPSCNGTACTTMQCIAQNVEIVSGGSFICSSAVPCHSLLCNVSDGEKLNLTVLECNKPAAVKLVNTYSGDVKFIHTFTNSEMVDVTISGTAVTLNVTIQHLKGGTMLGLQIDVIIPDQGTVTFVPYSKFSIDTFSCSCSSGPPCVPFIDLGAEAVTLPRVNDGASGPITLPSGFPFGKQDHYPSTVYVTTDGYFSVGDDLTLIPQPHLFSNDSSFDGIVAPFWADADPSKAGEVSYQIFTRENGSELLEKTSALIESRVGISSIDGGWMLVAEWHQVPQFDSTNMATNTFQGILFKVNNVVDAYAVFTYHCGNTSGMQWSGNATIGWKSGAEWRNHPLSGSPNASSIACNNYPSVGVWSNMVYRLVAVESCPGQYGCAYGLCVPLSEVCDGQKNCNDGSDESGCSSLPPSTPVPPTPTAFCNGTACATMQCIAQNINDVFGPEFDCSSSAVPCNKLLCSYDLDFESLELTILECNQPAAVRLVTRNVGNLVLFNHVFTHSEMVPITFLENNITLNVTIKHLLGGTVLGLQMDFIVPDHGTSTFVPHSEIPLATSSCSPDRTCSAMESIAQDAEIASDGLTCFTNPPCSEVDCAVDTGEELQFIVLKCNDPPAIQLLLKNKDNAVVYDRTFTQSEFATLVTGGSRKILNITLTHSDKAIGVQIDVLIPEEQTGYQTFVRYTSIPIDTSTCSQSGNSNLTVAIAVPLGVALVVVLLVLVVLISVLLYRRRKGSEYRFRPMSTFADTDE